MPYAEYPRAKPVEPAGDVRYDPWIEHLAWLMDSSIGVGPWSIGVDGLLGLVPGIGDLAGAVISMLIVMRAVRAGVPRVAVARMMTNIALDTVLGSVPVAGDVFDFAYKANIKNLRIYQQSLARGRAANVRHWAFFASLALGLLLLMGTAVTLAVLAIRAR